jgi:Ring finger domain
MSRQPYQSIVLNDLHTYFPDLLYRPTRFNNVPDVLNYVIGVARHNPYDEMRTEYEQRLADRTVPSPPPTRVSSNVGMTGPSNQARPSARVGMSGAYRSPLSTDIFYYDRNVGIGSTSIYQGSVQIGIGSSTGSSTYPSRTAPSSVSRTIPASNAADQLITSFLSGIIGDIPSTDFSQLQAFLDQPVIVRPTDDQIYETTSLIVSPMLQEDNCAICQDPIEEQQMMRIINHCTHSFHQMCIDTWFTNHVTCPTCRHDIRNQ